MAALICLVSSYACVSLLHHARRASGRMRLVWTSIGALSVGFGIWAALETDGFYLAYQVQKRKRPV